MLFVRFLFDSIKRKRMFRGMHSERRERTPGNLTTKGATAWQKAMRPVRGKLTVNRISPPPSLRA